MKSPLDKLFGYQARLQGVANSLGEELETFEFDFEPFDVEIPTFDWEDFLDVQENGKTEPQTKSEEPVSNNSVASVISSPSSQAMSTSASFPTSEESPESPNVEPAPDEYECMPQNRKRMVILYPEERSKELAEFFGLQSLEKGFYDVEEILD